MHFYLINQKGIPRLAVPVSDRSFQNKSLNYLKVFSTFGKFWLFIIKYVFKIKAQDFFVNQKKLTELPIPPFILGYLLKEADLSRSIFLFPKKKDRKKFSLLIFEKDKCKYKKIAYDQKSIEELLNEEKILKRITDRNFNNFKIPKFYGSYKTKDFYINEHQCLPPDGKIINKWTTSHVKIWKEITGVDKQSIICEKSEWYSNIEKFILNLNLINWLKNKKLRFSMVHGDFTPWNILFFNNEIFLIDFEESSFQAPFLFDPLHFEVASSFFIRKNKIDKVLKNAYTLCYKLYSENDFSQQFLAAVLHEVYYTNFLSSIDNNFLLENALLLVKDNMKF